MPLDEYVGGAGGASSGGSGGLAPVGGSGGVSGQTPLGGTAGAMGGAVATGGSAGSDGGTDNGGAPDAGGMAGEENGGDGPTSGRGGTVGGSAGDGTGGMGGTLGGTAGMSGSGGLGGMSGSGAGTGGCGNPDLSTDHEHCGSCENACEINEECLEGSCTSSPCDGICTTFTSVTLSPGMGYKRDNIGTGEVCAEVTGYDVSPEPPSLVCWNFDNPKVLELNGVVIDCNGVGQEFDVPLRVGGYCVHVAPGTNQFRGFEFPD